MKKITHIIWHITNLCNQQCCYCFTKSVKINNRYRLPEKIYAPFVDFINRLKPLKVSIIGGEPLIISNLSEIIEKIDDNIKIQIDSSLSLPIDDLIHFKNKISFSTTFDGHISELHNKTRSLFEETLKNTKTLLEFGFEVKANIVVNKFNIRYIEKILDFLSSLGIRRVGLLKVKDYDFNSPVLVCNLSEEETKKFSKKLPEIKKKYSHMNITASGFYEKDMNMLPSCMCGITKLTIDWHGNVYPCELMPIYKKYFEYYSKYYPGFKEIPSVNMDIEEVLNSGVFRLFREVLNYIPLGCDECAFKSRCNHGCRFLALIKTGSLFGKNLDCFRTNKNVYEIFGLEYFLPDSKLGEDKFKIVKEFVINHLGTQNKNALEIGCGIGRYSFALEKYFHKYVGIDINKEFIELAKYYKQKLKSKIIFYLEDFKNFDFQGYEIILMLGNTIAHFDRNSLKILKEKSKGKTLIFDMYVPDITNGKIRYGLGLYQIEEIIKTDNEKFEREIINLTTKIRRKMTSFGYSTGELEKIFLPKSKEYLSKNNLLVAKYVL